MSPIQRQNALAFIAHTDDRDYHALGDLLADSFTHRFLPASMGGFGMAVRSKQEFLDYVKGLESFFERFNVRNFAAEQSAC